MRFGVFWQTPGSEGSSVARRHWETIEEITLGEQLGFESAWLAESVFYPTRPMSNPLMVAIATAQHTERIRFGTLAVQAPIYHSFPMATESTVCAILTQGRLDLCSEHLARFGAVLWRRERYLRALAKALQEPTHRGRWRVLDREEIRR